MQRRRVPGHRLFDRSLPMSWAAAVAFQLVAFPPAARCSAVANRQRRSRMCRSSRLREVSSRDERMFEIGDRGCDAEWSVLGRHCRDGYQPNRAVDGSNRLSPKTSGVVHLSCGHPALMLNRRYDDCPAETCLCSHYHRHRNVRVRNRQYWVVTAATGTNQTAPLTEAIVQARKHPALFTSVADIRH